MMMIVGCVRLCFRATFVCLDWSSMMMSMCVPQSVADVELLWGNKGFRLCNIHLLRTNNVKVCVVLWGVRKIQYGGLRGAIWLLSSCITMSDLGCCHGDVRYERRILCVEVLLLWQLGDSY